MPYRGTPVVRGRMLSLDASSPSRIEVGTPAWFRWLEQADCFSYLPSHTIYRFTMRKEKRRQRWYWYAYLKVESKLHNAYLGRSQELTEARLAWVTQHLLAKVKRTNTTHLEGEDMEHCAR